MHTRLTTTVVVVAATLAVAAPASAHTAHYQRSEARFATVTPGTAATAAHVPSRKRLVAHAARKIMK